MRRLVLLPFLTLLCLSLLPPALPAAGAARPRTLCQCMPQPLGWRWENAGAVFTGTVTHIEVVTEWTQRGNDDIPVKVSVRILEGLKGVEKGQTFLLHTNIQKHTCTGHPFEKGKDYLFFAYERKAEIYESWSQYDFPSGTYDVGGLCGGVRLLDAPGVAAEMEELKAKPRDGALLEEKDGVVGLPPEKPPSAH